MSEETPKDNAAMRAFPWQSNLGLIIGGSTSILVCLKILAVANWDSTTAFGILAASGTVNVLTGTLLAVLPMIYGYVYVFVLPRVERKLQKRTPVERSAARILETWPAILLVFLLPAYLYLITLAAILLIIGLSLWESARAKKKKLGRVSKHTSDDRPSRFEITSVALATIVVLSFSSLSTPWIPAEVVEVESEPESAYLLRTDNERATVLLADSRRLEQIEAKALTGEYCQRVTRWFSEPLYALWREPRYPACPS